MGVPAAGGHDGRAIITAFGLAADFAAHGLPGFAVAGFFTGEGVGDFVQNSFANGGLIVGFDEIGGELDLPHAIAAKSQRAFAAVPGEPPMGEAMIGHEVQGELAGVGNFHELLS